MRMADRGARDTNKPGAYAKWPIVSDSILLLRFFSEIRFQCFSEMTPVACTSCRSQRCNSVQLAVPGNRMTPPPFYTLHSRTFKVQEPSRTVNNEIVTKIMRGLEKTQIMFRSLHKLRRYGVLSVESIVGASYHRW